MNIDFFGNNIGSTFKITLNNDNIVPVGIYEIKKTEGKVKFMKYDVIKTTIN